jgi:hypothetical protein
VSYNKDQGAGPTRQIPAGVDGVDQVPPPPPPYQPAPADAGAEVAYQPEPQPYTGQTTGDVPYQAGYPQQYPEQGSGGVPYDGYGEDYDPAEYSAQYTGDLGYDVPGQTGVGSPPGIVPASGQPAGMPAAPWAPSSPAAGLPASVPPAQPSNVRPGIVNTAVICMIVGLAVTLLAFGLMLLNQPDLVAQQVKSPMFSVYQADGVQSLVQVAIYVIGGVSSIYALVVAVFALFVLRRKRKARLFADILLWISLVVQIGLLATGGLLPGSAGYNALSNALSGINILLTAAAAILLVLPATGRWLRNKPS